MDTKLLSVIHQQNPWLKDPHHLIAEPDHYIDRLQFSFLAQPDWDAIWTILIGPRQAGKTTLGKHLCQELIKLQRYQQLLYLNCDYHEIRLWPDQQAF